MAPKPTESFVVFDQFFQEVLFVVVMGCSFCAHEAACVERHHARHFTIRTGHAPNDETTAHSREDFLTRSRLDPADTSASRMLPRK
jgi:hypothetical protein